MRFKASFIIGFIAAIPAFAQAPNDSPVDFRGGWSWEQLYHIPNVDTARVTWLRNNLSEKDAREAFAIAGSLSKAAAAQAMPGLFYLDGRSQSVNGKKMMDSLALRPADGDAGTVRLAYLAGWYRKIVVDAYRGSGYRLTFDSAETVIPDFVKTGKTMPRGFDLSFDFAPVDTLTAIVLTPDITPQQVIPRISTHKFDALIHHHSQSFYTIPLSRELLALNLSHAASTQPMDRLYSFMAPHGLLHYTDLRNNAEGFAKMVAVLKSRETDIMSYVANTISNYVDADTRLTRRVSLFVVDWSDGWGADDVTAVDIEYYKGDMPRFINTLLHETFHATQHAIAEAHHVPEVEGSTPQEHALRVAAGYILYEGTANYVAPTIGRTPESAAQMADSGTALLRQLADLVNGQGGFNGDSAQKINDAGVAGGGPYYWLGAAMAKVIADQNGPKSIGRAFNSDPIEFIRTYARLAAKTKGGGGLIPPSFLAALPPGQRR
jgi:hypothetical protein